MGLCLKRLVKKSVLSVFVLVIALGGLDFQIEKAGAAATADTITVSLAVGATISNDCTEPITMGGITGTGQSALGTNSTTCTIITNNSSGYNLVWQASAATMTSGADTIAAYTPTVADTPEQWAVAAAASEWGAHLDKDSDTVDTDVWGTTDDYASVTSKWLNVKNTATFQIASRATETLAAGDSEIVTFGAEVGASKFQPTGTYTVDVTMTATTNP